jgi:hypothetical protein
MTNEHSKKVPGAGKAAKRDTCFYAEHDEDIAGYGVFGASSGHCYASFSSKREAEAYAEELNGFDRDTPRVVVRAKDGE